MRKILVLISLVVWGCRPASQNTTSYACAIEVTNPLDFSRRNVLIRIPEHTMYEMMPEFNTDIAGIRVVDREAEVASEYINHTLVIVLDSMTAKEKRTLNVYYSGEPRNYRKRTQAELSHKIGGEWKNREYIGGQYQTVNSMRVPPEHKDHSWFFRYEGPGWESDKVGYRLYLDQRNAIDVFGKKTDDLILIGVGQDGFDSYHEMQSWGMDIMKVGNSLGLGSIGMWADTSAVRVEKTDSVLCEINDGPLSSSIGVNYYGWKTPKDTVDLSSWLFIHAGTRLTLNSVNVHDRDDVKISTGIVKDKNTKVFKSEGDDSSFGYIATYGKQSLNNDNLGLVVTFSHDSFAGFHEDAFSNVVELKEASGPSSPGTIDYYFGAAWELEPNGITNEKDFMRWVERSARELANPVNVNVK